MPGCADRPKILSATCTITSAVRHLRMLKTDQSNVAGRGVAERPFEHDIGVLSVLHVARVEDAVGQSEKLIFIL